MKYRILRSLCITHKEEGKYDKTLSHRIQELDATLNGNEDKFADLLNIDALADNFKSYLKIKGNRSNV